MEYSNWPQPELPQNQTSLPSSYPPSSYPYTTNYLSYPQNPNPSSSLPQSSLEPVLNPPGVDSYTPLNSNNPITSQPITNLNYTQTQVVVDSNSLMVPSSGYYFDPNSQNWAAREAVRQYGTDPATYAAGISVPSNGSEQLAMVDPNSTWWTNTTTQPHANGTWKKHPKKAKTKIVQSAYCEVCKIDCTSKEVLDQHKLGKKHKKNLDKLRESLNPTQVQPSVSLNPTQVQPSVSLNPTPVQPSGSLNPTQVPVQPSGSSNPVIGPQLPSDKSKSISGNKSKRKKVETAADLEKKKKKVLDGGAAVEAVRICGICNVVCNSETVYNFHLAGQKHAAMLKKASHHTQSNAI